MSMEIVCPSGLSGRIRGMKAREERILADRKLVKSGTQIDQILAACWEETLDPGPYSFGLSAPNWSEVLVGDRFYVLLQIRARSYGSMYEFSVPCSNRECRARIDWELDLHDLPVARLSDDSRAALLSGRTFRTTLRLAGRQVEFRLMRGADERRMSAQRRAAGERPLTTMLGLRIESIDGVEPKDKARFLEDLEMADVTFLLGEFDRVDCGVETEIEVECPECFALTTVELPFDKGFFLPQRKRPSAASSSSSACQTSTAFAR
jgi:hypothetical protein